ncbi:endonuclease/exonuclease/phosphatase family protein [Marivirga sp.]|uniref:endonuclease/exonuclease/phosphatase family protein n=1 Tax=Marivirga sp. TaxID=2018662 RepID=UPI003DA7058F
MKKIFLLFISTFLTVEALAQTKVCTFNIRFENPRDGVHQWENRKESVVQFLKLERPDVVGMQEVLHSQIMYFNTSLPNYQKIGVGRDDGKKAGEYSPIYFNKDVYDLMDSGTFWLGENINVPEKGWDAALPRVCTWAKLKGKKSGESILFLNTHFDHVGKEARKKSVDLILTQIEKLKTTNKVVLMGDFNLEPSTIPIQKIFQSTLNDAYEADINLGPVGTYNAFQIGKNYDRRIDYVFYEGFEVKSYHNYSMRIKDTFLSDHFPVLVELE